MKLQVAFSLFVSNRLPRLLFSGREGGGVLYGCERATGSGAALQDRSARPRTNLLVSLLGDDRIARIARTDRSGIAVGDRLHGLAAPILRALLQPSRNFRAL